MGTGIKLDLCFCIIPTVGLYGKLGEVTATHNRTSRMSCRCRVSTAALRRLYRRQSSLLLPMDLQQLANAAATTHTVGGRPVNIDGHWGHLPNKLLFRRDARLAQDDDRLMTAPFPHCLETATATAPWGVTPCPPSEHGCVQRPLDSMSRARTLSPPPPSSSSSSPFLPEMAIFRPMGELEAHPRQRSPHRAPSHAPHPEARREAT